MAQIYIGYQTIGGQNAELTFKRIRTLRLSLDPTDGRLKISAPVGMGLDRITAFVLSKEPWIARHQERLRGLLKSVPSWEPGSVHPVWGKGVPLAVQERTGSIRMNLQADQLILGCPPGADEEKKQKALDRLYARLIDQALPPLLDRWQRVMGVWVRQFSVRKMKTRWGSCKPSEAKICLNSELAKKPPALLEMVVVHELVHLLEPSHNHRFKALMDRFLPDWRARHQALRSAGDPVKTDF